MLRKINLKLAVKCIKHSHKLIYNQLRLKKNRHSVKTIN